LSHQEVKFETVYSLITDRNAPDQPGVPCRTGSKKLSQHPHPHANNNKGCNNSNKAVPGHPRAPTLTSISNSNNHHHHHEHNQNGHHDDIYEEDEDELYWFSSLRVVDPRSDFKDERLCKLARLVSINGEVKDRMTSISYTKTQNFQRHESIKSNGNLFKTFISSSYD
jgi:hypothetical protein